MVSSYICDDLIVNDSTFFQLLALIKKFVSQNISLHLMLLKYKAKLLIYKNIHFHEPHNIKSPNCLSVYHNSVLK